MRERMVLVCIFLSEAKNLAPRKSGIKLEKIDVCCTRPAITTRVTPCSLKKRIPAPSCPRRNA